jgi:hypothetical protein
MTIFLFWFWPARDLQKVRKIKGIGLNEEAKFDDETVQGWKAGRIRAKQLWMGFGTLIIFGVMLNLVLTTFWRADGLTPDAQLDLIFSYIQIGCIGVGLLGWFGGLIYSAHNNQKYLGQLRVKM